MKDYFREDSGALIFEDKDPKIYAEFNHIHEVHVFTLLENGTTMVKINRGNNTTAELTEEDYCGISGFPKFPGDIRVMGVRTVFIDEVENKHLFYLDIFFHKGNTYKESGKVAITSMHLDHNW